MEVPGFIIDNIKFPNRGLRHLLSRDIVQQLIYNYGQNYQYNIKNKKNSKLYESRDPSLPFDNLIYCTYTIQYYAIYGSRPIPDNGILDYMYTGVFDMGVFSDEFND